MTAAPYPVYTRFKIVNLQEGLLFTPPYRPVIITHLRICRRLRLVVQQSAHYDLKRLPVLLKNFCSSAGFPNNTNKGRILGFTLG